MRVNGTDFRGVICHTSVATDDGSSQHSDLITPADYQRALGTKPVDPPKKGKKLTLIQTHGLQADEIYITDEMTRRRCAKWEVDLYAGLFKAPIQNRPYTAFHALPDVTPADFKYE